MVRYESFHLFQSLMKIKTEKMNNRSCCLVFQFSWLKIHLPQLNNSDFIRFHPHSKTPRVGFPTCRAYAKSLAVQGVTWYRELELSSGNLQGGPRADRYKWGES